MRKLPAPPDDPLAVYDACVAAVEDAGLRLTYTSNRAHIEQGVTAFGVASAAVAWARLPRARRGHPHSIIAGGLTKKHLVDLYSEYMVGANGASRKIYDDIFVAAGGICPFCGGLGQVKNLDHYLPKARFPIYSTLPQNLVPSCRDCNTGKNSNFGLDVGDQTLHPYLDDDKYFDRRWLSATISKSNPIIITYFCDPPGDWPDTDRKRVNQHFISYEIAYRFSIQAGGEITKLLDLRRKSLRILSPAGFRAYLIDNANTDSFDVNGWSRTMYAALAATKWFCETDFNTADWHLI